MPVVTDIKRQKNQSTRYSVYLDGEYGFVLSDLELSFSELRVGQVLTLAQVESYQDQSKKDKAFRAALKYLSVRPRSRYEVLDYLRRREYEAVIIEQAVRQLEEKGLINDYEFAVSWVSSRQLLRPRSRRMLEQELTAKRVPRDVVANVLSDLDDNAELEQLVRVASKKVRLSQYQNFEKLFGYLSRQGYDAGLIKKALARLDEVAVKGLDS